MDELWEQARQKAVVKMEAAIKTLQDAQWPPDFSSTNAALFENALAAGYLMAMLGFERVEAAQGAGLETSESRLM